MNRRQAFLALLLLLNAHGSSGQAGRRVYRIGYPAISPVDNLRHVMAAFEQGLRDLGYEPGKDVLIDLRSAEGNLERYPRLVQDILRAKPDVILTGVNANTTAVMAATQTIPIVMTLGSDVIRAGYAKTLARPGGNVTGLTSDVGGEVVTKRLELFREAVPGIVRLAILSEPPQRVEYLHAVNHAASVWNMQTLWVEYSGEPARDYRRILDWRADAILALTQARMYGRRFEIGALGVKHRLPSAYGASEFVEAGGLIAYGANLSALYRAAATYVDKIFKGAKPGELPIEQPSRIDFVINMKTAQALDIKVPPSILLRADRVIN